MISLSPSLPFPGLPSFNNPLVGTHLTRVAPRPRDNIHRDGNVKVLIVRGAGFANGRVMQLQSDKEVLLFCCSRNINECNLEAFEYILASISVQFSFY